jgi:hypothetical protein
MKTLIFDSNATRLQWTSNRETYLEALEEFDAALGTDPHNRDLNPADWTFYRMTDEKAKEVILAFGAVAISREMRGEAVILASLPKPLPRNPRRGYTKGGCSVGRD